MTSAEVQAAAADQSVIYVYGVARAARKPKSLPPPLAGIIPGAPVDRLVHGNLMAFVSAVPVAQFGPREFPAALNDADWLKDRILAHEAVLEELRSSYDLVPFRFGTLYLDSRKVVNALARHRAELYRALDRIRDASEWGVKLFCDFDALRRQIEVEFASVRELRERLAHASPGARFFLQKNYAKTRDSEVAATIATCVQRIHASLAACARESVEIDVQPAAVHGRSANMVMNAAYLVAASSLPRFRQTLATLREHFAADGFGLELTGPWPPYHFVSMLQEGVADATKPAQ